MNQGLLLGSGAITERVDVELPTRKARNTKMINCMRMATPAPWLCLAPRRKPSSPRRAPPRPGRLYPRCQRRRPGRGRAHRRCRRPGRRRVYRASCRSSSARVPVLIDELSRHLIGHFPLIQGASQSEEPASRISPASLGLASCLREDLLLLRGRQRATKRHCQHEFKLRICTWQLTCRWKLVRHLSRGRALAALS